MLQECFLPKRLLKIIAIIMATGIVLWLYSFGGMYGLPWPDLQIVGLYVSSNLDIAAVLEGSHKQEQGNAALLLHINVHVCSYYHVLSSVCISLSAELIDFEYAVYEL